MNWLFVAPEATQVRVAPMTEIVAPAAAVAALKSQDAVADVVAAVFAVPSPSCGTPQMPGVDHGDPP